MNKKILGIAVVLLVFFVAGVIAQTGRTADQLVSRWEAIVKSFESLERDTRNARAFGRASERRNYEQNLQNLQRDLRRLGEDTNLFYANGGDFTAAQQRRIDAVGNNIQNLAMQIARNLEDLVN